MRLGVSRASPSSAGRGPGRRAARRRRRRRSRPRARRRARPGRASRSRARAPRRARGSGLGWWPVSMRPIVAARGASTSIAYRERGRGTSSSEIEPRVLPALRGPQGRARDRARSTSATRACSAPTRSPRCASSPRPRPVRRRRGLRYLLQFALDGLLGAQTKAEAAGARRGSRRRSRSSSTASRSRIARSPVEQANEPDPDRRAALEEARDAAARVERLNPLLPGGARALARALPRARLGRATRTPTRSCAASTSPRSSARRARFSTRPRTPTRRRSTPSSTRSGLPPLGELRRSDLPRFFRAADLDAAIRRRASGRLASRRRWPGSGSTSTRSPTSTSTPSRGRRSRRAPSAPRCGCRTRSTS